MEDYHVSKFVHFQGHELGLFAIYDGHLGDSVPAYLQKHLFSNILKDVSIRFKVWHYLSLFKQGKKFVFMGIYFWDYVLKGKMFSECST